MSKQHPHPIDVAESIVEFVNGLTVGEIMILLNYLEKSGVLPNRDAALFDTLYALLKDEVFELMTHDDEKMLERADKLLLKISGLNPDCLESPTEIKYEDQRKLMQAADVLNKLQDRIVTAIQRGEIVAPKNFPKKPLDWWNELIERAKPPRGSSRVDYIQKFWQTTESLEGRRPHDLRTPEHREHTTPPRDELLLAPTLPRTQYAAELILDSLRSGDFDGATLCEVRNVAIARAASVDENEVTNAAWAAVDTIIKSDAACSSGNPLDVASGLGRVVDAVSSYAQEKIEPIVDVPIPAKKIPAWLSSAMHRLASLFDAGSKHLEWCLTFVRIERSIGSEAKTQIVVADANDAKTLKQMADAAEYAELRAKVFGRKKPSIDGLNKYLMELSKSPSRTTREQKVETCRVINYWKGNFGAPIELVYNKTSEPCILSAKSDLGNGAYQLRRTGDHQEIYSLTAFPALSCRTANSAST